MAIKANYGLPKESMKKEDQKYETTTAIFQCKIVCLNSTEINTITKNIESVTYPCFFDN